LSDQSRLLSAACLFAGIFGTLAPAQTPSSTVSTIPDDTKPIRVAGLGIRVSNYN